MDIKNKVAVVTGAGKGIGRAISMALAKEGASLAILSRNKKDLDLLAREASNYGNKTLPITIDLSRESLIKNAISEVAAKLGGVDILINNAGLGRFGRIEELTSKDWDEMFETNLRGMFLCIRETLPHLKRKSESVIVNISSLAGKNTFAGGAGYCATKWGVMALSKCLMLEERENGVRTIVVCPGSVDTHFFAHPSLPNPKRDKVLKPQDVADTIMTAIKLPQRAMVSEIELRPTNP